MRLRKRETKKELRMRIYELQLDLKDMEFYAEYLIRKYMEVCGELEKLEDKKECRELSPTECCSTT